MTPSFWSGRTVLVTGHTGFKGSWVSLWLSQLGATVVGLALDPPSSPSLFEQARVADRVTHVHGDVRDLDTVMSVVDRYRPEVVLHMAAQTLVGEGYVSPVYTYATNVMGTVNVLEAMRQIEGVRAGVMVTTDKCYDNKEWCYPYRETDRLGGKDPYSNSKACAELVTAAYRASYFDQGTAASTAAIATARAGNVIGGGDWADNRLVPDIIRGFVDKETIQIRSPHAIRPWQHVLEPLAGYLTLAEFLVHQGPEAAHRHGAWNFGPRDEDARTVEWVVEYMRKQWGEGARWTRDARVHPPEATYLKLDSSKARADLSWQPCLGLSQALDWTVDWYRRFEAGEDLQAFTLQQIEAYESLRTHRSTPADIALSAESA